MILPVALNCVYFSFQVETVTGIFQETTNHLLLDMHSTFGV